MSSHTSITTALTVVEDSFTWKIENFQKAIKSSDLLHFQTIQYKAFQDNEKFASTWKFSFKEMRNKSLELNLFADLPDDDDDDDDDDDEDKSKTAFQFTCKFGEISRSSRMHAKQLHCPKCFQEESMFFLTKERKMETDFLDADGSLNMNCTITIYISSQTKVVTQTSPLEKFQLEAKKKAVEDLGNASNENLSDDDVKIKGKGGRVFAASKRVLMARSPVMEAMFRSDMEESRTGILKIDDISAEALKVLLHFIKCGELLPEWNQKDVVLKLTYAAHKYELMDLLEFLNKNLGSMCDLQNAAEFLSAARKFSLESATKDILQFVKENAINSVETLDGFIESYLQPEKETSKKRRLQ